MKKGNDEDRHRRHFQSAYDPYRKTSYQEGRYGREDRKVQDERGRERSEWNAYPYRDDASDRTWSSSHRIESPQEKYGYRDSAQDMRSQRYQDSNLGRRNSYRNTGWDDRQLRNQGSAHGYPTSSYGSDRFSSDGWEHEKNANRYSYGNSDRDSYGREGQGNFGSHEDDKNLGRESFQDSRNGQSLRSQGYGPTSHSLQQSGSYAGHDEGYDESFAYGGDRVTFRNKSGRGPKGYKRSDERIKEEFCDLLTSHPEIDPSEVEIQVNGAEITLSGTVENRHEKRLIEDLACSLSGVAEVSNQLRVSKGQASEHRF